MPWVLEVLAIPVLVCILGKVLWRKEVTWREYATIQAATLVLVMVFGLVAQWRSITDTEVHNGHLVEKTSGSSGCCHCIMVCTSCGKDCTTCYCTYPHLADYWWGFRLSTGDEMTVKACEPNRNDAPARWVEAVVGEPASAEHEYTNYFLADRESLLNAFDASPEYLEQVPPFPLVYDWYRRDPVVTMGVTVSDEWATRLREVNGLLGEEKQIDIVVVFTASQDPRWADAVDAKWVHAKKNSLVVVAGVLDHVVTWARVISISKVESLKVAVRDGMIGLNVLYDASKGVEALRQQVNVAWERTSMEEYRYLVAGATPTRWWSIAVYAFAALISVLGVLLAIAKDFYEEEGWRKHAWVRRTAGVFYGRVEDIY